MAFKFATSCVNSTAEAIHAMQEAAHKICLETFTCRVNRKEWVALRQSLGYNFRGWRKFLEREIEFGYVSICKSTYMGYTCYYIEHSRIEYIFCEPKFFTGENSGRQSNTENRGPGVPRQVH